MARISQTGKTKLIDAQRAWIKYRDAQCDFGALSTVGGSIHPMMIARCMSALTKTQTKTLGNQLYCLNGDLPCGG